MKNLAIILPIMGMHVPFHISVLKNLSKHEEGRFTSLRFNFHIPGPSSSLANVSFPEIDSNSIIVYEVIFRSSD